LAAIRERGSFLRPAHSKALGEGSFELRSVKHDRLYFVLLLMRVGAVVIDWGVSNEPGHANKQHEHHDGDQDPELNRPVAA
jgi:hypothetical protein